jgi:hypothetical protein
VSPTRPSSQPSPGRSPPRAEQLSPREPPPGQGTRRAHASHAPHTLGRSRLPISAGPCSFQPRARQPGADCHTDPIAHGVTEPTQSLGGARESAGRRRSDRCLQHGQRRVGPIHRRLISRAGDWGSCSSPKTSRWATTSARRRSFFVAAPSLRWAPRRRFSATPRTPPHVPSPGWNLVHVPLSSHPRQGPDRKSLVRKPLSQSRWQALRELPHQRSGWLGAADQTRPTARDGQHPGVRGHGHHDKSTHRQPGGPLT